MKYELRVITCVYWIANEKFQSYQKDGWELAGNISISNETDEVRIPLKRLIE
ncbi:MAG TPA: hypothetical protein VF680_17030 [Allosphingosinicella sp.]|jgi:hypothetical protein